MVKKDELFDFENNELKSSFNQIPVLGVIGKYKWVTWQSFEYYRTNNKEEVITIPKGHITDLASVPRFLWSVLPPLGLYTKAAIIHDYLYQQAIGSKEYADEVFLEAMEVAGVPKIRRIPMYYMVKLFGRGNYDYSHRQERLFKFITFLNRSYKIYSTFKQSKGCWNIFKRLVKR